MGRAPRLCGVFPSRWSNDTTFQDNLQSPRKCRKIFKMNISAVFSGFLRIPNSFICGHDFDGTNLSHHKIYVSSEKTFYFESGSVSQIPDAIICFDYFSENSRIVPILRHIPQGACTAAPQIRTNVPESTDRAALRQSAKIRRSCASKKPPPERIPPPAAARYTIILVFRFTQRPDGQHPREQEEPQRRACRDLKQQLALIDLHAEQRFLHVCP